MNLQFFSNIFFTSINLVCNSIFWNKSRPIINYYYCFRQMALKRNRNSSNQFEHIFGSKYYTWVNCIHILYRYMDLFFLPIRHNRLKWNPDDSCNTTWWTQKLILYPIFRINLYRDAYFKARCSSLQIIC